MTGIDESGGNFPSAEDGEQGPNVDYYRQLIVETIDNTRVVAAAKLPEDIGPNLYVGIRVDENNLPVPEPAVQSVNAVRDLNNPGTGRVLGGRTESHFRDGGAEPTLGVLELDTNTFIPFANKGALREIVPDEGDGDPANMLRRMAEPVNGEKPGLPEMVGIASGLSARDWSDLNNWSSPSRLAAATAKAAVDALWATKLIGIAPSEPGQQFDETPLFRQIATEVADKATWQRLTNPNQPTPEVFLRSLQTDYDNNDYLKLRAKLTGVVAAKVTPVAEQVIQSHQQEIAALDHYSSRDMEELAQEKAAATLASAEMPAEEAQSVATGEEVTENTIVAPDTPGARGSHRRGGKIVASLALAGAAAGLAGGAYAMDQDGSGSGRAPAVAQAGELPGGELGAAIGRAAEAPQQQETLTLYSFMDQAEAAGILQERNVEAGQSYSDVVYEHIGDQDPDRDTLLKLVLAMNDDQDPDVIQAGPHDFLDVQAPVVQLLLQASRADLSRADPGVQAAFMKLARGYPMGPRAGMEAKAEATAALQDILAASQATNVGGLEAYLAKMLKTQPVGAAEPTSAVSRADSPSAATTAVLGAAVPLAAAHHPANVTAAAHLGRRHRSIRRRLGFGRRRA